VFLLEIYSVLEEIKKNQKRGVRPIPYLKSDGTTGEFPAAKRGNSTYAWKTEKKMKNYRECFLYEAIDRTILFITLTVPYGKTFLGCRDSWQFVSEALSPFTKALKRLGMEKFLLTLEATRKGGCHVHLLTQWDKPLKTRKVKNKFFLADSKLSRKIREK
jgi:hypothetical protein